MLRRAAQALNKATSPLPSLRKESLTNTVDDKVLDAIFDSYLPDTSSPKSDRLDAEGVGKFIEALGITDPETDVQALVVMFKCRAASMYSLTRIEFKNAFLDTDSPSLSSFKSKLSEITEFLLDSGSMETFRPFYKWVFAAAREGQAKIISKDLACGLWTVVLSRGDAKRSTFLSSFIKWLKTQDKITQITADQWGMFLDFNMRIKPDLSNLETEAGWLPTMLEAFAASLKTHNTSTSPGLSSSGTSTPLVPEKRRNDDGDKT